MDETTIATQLKQSITSPPSTVLGTVAKVVEPQSGVPVIYPLDELVQYKLHDYFGEQYRSNDDIAKTQIQFIYDNVSKMVDNPEYGFVLAKIRDLESILGFGNGDNRIYKLYQWLRLEGVRKNIDAEMGALQHG